MKVINVEPEEDDLYGVIVQVREPPLLNTSI
jgi:hypothetical protein